MTDFLKFFTRLTGIFMVALWLSTSPAQALTILYPGSFDPFHLTHESEARGVIALLKPDHFVILPIESAGYNSPHGVSQPSFFPYEDRLQLIRAEFASDSRVELSSEFRSLQGHPISRIIEFASRQNDKDWAVLIGSDVLKKWTSEPQLSDLLKSGKIYVTLDPYAKKLNNQLYENFKWTPKVQFIDLSVTGYRSTQLVRELFTGSDSSINKLPLASRRMLNAEQLQAFGESYRKQLTAYLLEIAKIEGPLLSQNLPAGTHQLTQNWVHHASEHLDFFLALLSPMPSPATLRALLPDHVVSKEKILDEFLSFAKDPKFLQSETAKALIFGKENIWDEAAPDLRPSVENVRCQNLFKSAL